MKNLAHLLLIFPLTFCVNCLNAKVVKILIQGDTQKIMDPANGKQDNFVPLMAKLLTDPVTRDAEFVLQMGDIVDSRGDNSARPQQYAVAQEGWEQLDGKIPYVLNLGNNDNAEEYFTAFGNLPEPLAENSDRRNFAYSFNAGGIDWLVISMRFWEEKEKKAIKDAELDWATTLIEANSDKKVIFIKHEVNSGSGVVKALKAYPNVVCILSGHTKSRHTILTGNSGNKIAWIRTCHHDARLDSYFRVLLIDTVKGVISSRFYSPQYEKFWHDPTAPYHDCLKSAPWAYTGFDFGMAESAVPDVQENDAEFVSLDVPCCVTAGDEFEVTARVLNTGSALWNASLQENRYKLGSANSRGNQNWGKGTGRTNISKDVLPEAYHTFEINCTAPVETGYYNFRRQMVKEGKEWFGDYSENRVVYIFLNQAANPSFENDETRSRTWTLGAGASWTNLEKKSGISSLKLSGPSTATSQTLQLEKNTNYILHFWAKRKNKENLTDAEKDQDNAFLDIYDTKEKNNRLRLKVANDAANGKWVQFLSRFNSGHSDSLQLRMYGRSLKSTVYFDDIVLKLSTPTVANFASASEFTAYKGIEFSLEGDVAEYDDASLNYLFKSMPEWLSFDHESSVFRGTPDDKDMGVHAVTFCVQDDEQETLFAFTVNVLAEPPSVHWNNLYNIDEVTSDRDRDGLVNFLEFALGGNPDKDDAASKLPKFIKDGSSFGLNFRRNHSTLNYTIQTSTDLNEWLDYIVVDDQHGLVGDSCTVDIPVSSETRFFKLEISQ